MSPEAKEQAPAKAEPAKKGDVLTLEGLTVARGGRPVVRDVSLHIDAGEVTALLGPNGAGKSSLVLAVGGVLRPEAGSVNLNGDDLSKRRPE
jgi:branched-chain amino acid transport system ATP-binding protein